MPRLRTVIPLFGLGRLAVTRADPQEAVALFERLTSIYEKHGVSPLDLAQARFQLARALWHATDERTRALALARQVRDDLHTETSKAGEDLLAEVTAWLADH